MPEDERAIRTLIANWMASTRAGDLPRVLSLMSEDVLFLVPGQPPFGKAEFAATSARMKDVRIDGKSDIQEIVVQGDWAWCRTQLTVTMTPAATSPGGPPVRRSGQTLSVLRKQSDGSWLLVRDANLLATVPAEKSS
jgi:uncharacterized protein (TIGR02246 family)